MANYTKAQKVRAIQEIKKVAGQPVVIEYVSVAKSGMSRRMRVIAGGDNITEAIATILGYAYDFQKGMNVTGYGMDMGFKVLFDTNKAIADFDGVNGNNHDLGCGYCLPTQYQYIDNSKKRR